MTGSLHARSLFIAVGPRIVLDEVDLQLAPGQRVGLVGPNGVGKSTLLRIAGGLLRPERGTVELRPRTATVGYLPQEPERTAVPVGQWLARRTGVAEAASTLEEATAALAVSDDPGGAEGIRYSEAFERWLALGAADFEARTGDVLDELGLDQDLLAHPMSTLSGGEAARVGLAALLLSRYDILLLDEPTNDLDLDGLDRLEGFVLGAMASSTAMALVSHDRTFLERVVTDVVELDEFTHRATRYGGGWSSYLDERATAARHAREAYEEYADKRSTLASRAQREREWATHGLSRVKNRPAHLRGDNDKNVKAFKINQTEQLAGRAARTERAMERLEVVEEPREPWQLRLQVATAERSGAVVARLEDAVVVRGGFTLGPVSIEVGAGERVIIVGPNGSGKTTLLEALLGELPLTSGRHWRGPSVVTGRLEQLRHQLTTPGGATSVLDDFRTAVGHAEMTTSDARTLLAKFGIGAAHVGRPTTTLSPGERTRLVLALLMAKGCNCLVLDEPTNHLDLPAIEQLEQALTTFPGTVLLISHDRTLLANVERTRTIAVAGGRIVADAPA